jgi:hypothetical protein
MVRLKWQKLADECRFAAARPKWRVGRRPETPQSSHIEHAPGKIRTCDLPLRRNIAQKAKEGQKWL